MRLRQEGREGWREGEEGGRGKDRKGGRKEDDSQKDR